MSSRWQGFQIRNRLASNQFLRPSRSNTFNPARKTLMARNKLDLLFILALLCLARGGLAGGEATLSQTCSCRSPWIPTPSDTAIFPSLLGELPWVSSSGVQQVGFMRCPQAPGTFCSFPPRLLLPPQFHFPLRPLEGVLVGRCAACVGLAGLDEVGMLGRGCAK